MTAAVDLPVPGVIEESLFGPSFVEALNDGLARARASALRARAAADRTRGAQELPDPFAAAVMAAYGAALPDALAPHEVRNVPLRSVLLRRGRRILAEALAGDDLPDDGPGGELPPRYEAVARTLLMECAVLMVLERREFRGGTARPADLVRALGRRARGPRAETGAGGPGQPAAGR
ncbi:hypothetical protein NX801_30090 [Streptomyces sp. LP05-1]|uniref:TetR family transcriptional regulator n=1 Tax=Streptomyces pyxinae TaxID=2970734 RepID=A0ABT2CQV8_9ACTN|nr:hypothetical protein [Streptomyces sp. LP05-1]MCS0639813.1 hypothetical protein [Streptomyces sp. LP05-1]